MATNFSNLRAVLTAATPIGLIAQLMIGAPSSFAQTSTAVFKPESQKIQLGNLRQLSLRLRSGQPVASSELDSYKEFCAEQASQANVRDTAQGKSDTRGNSRSQHFDNSNNWDKSHNKDSTYKQSGKVNVGLFGGSGRVNSDISRNDNGTNKGSQADISKTSQSSSSSTQDNRSSHSDFSRESAQDCAAVLEHLTAKVQSSAELAKANVEAAVKDREIAANERIRMAEIASQKELALMQAKLLRQQGESQQTQGWTQLGMGLLGNLLQPQQQAGIVQPDLAQLQQLILSQQAQIKALQQQAGK